MAHRRRKHGGPGRCAQLTKKTGKKHVKYHGKCMTKGAKRRAIRARKRKNRG